MGYLLFEHIPLLSHSTLLHCQCCYSLELPSLAFLLTQNLLLPMIFHAWKALVGWFFLVLFLAQCVTWVSCLAFCMFFLLFFLLHPAPTGCAESFCLNICCLLVFLLQLYAWSMLGILVDCIYMLFLLSSLSPCKHHISCLWQLWC